MIDTLKLLRPILALRLNKLVKYTNGVVELLLGLAAWLLAQLQRDRLNIDQLFAAIIAKTKSRRRRLDLLSFKHIDLALQPNFGSPTDQRHHLSRAGFDTDRYINTSHDRGIPRFLLIYLTLFRQFSHMFLKHSRPIIIIIIARE